MSSKEQELKQYSNISKVQKQAKKLGLNPVEISSRKDKKYMIRDDHGHLKHFGMMFAQDYTFHQDEKRRQSFLRRNHRWKDAPEYSPAFLSYYLLW
jgi:predicted solute-binding protein